MEIRQKVKSCCWWCLQTARKLFLIFWVEKRKLFVVVKCVFVFCFVRKGKKKRHKDLEYNTPCLLLLFHLQCSSCCCLKHFTYTLLGFSWTFQICKCINFLKHRFAFRRLHRLLLHLCQLFDCVRIISEIFFVTD